MVSLRSYNTITIHLPALEQPGLVLVADVLGLGVGHLELGDGVHHGHAPRAPSLRVQLPQISPALGAHVLHHGGVRAARGEPEDSLLRSQNITHLGLQLRDILGAWTAIIEWYLDKDFCDLPNIGTSHLANFALLVFEGEEQPARPQKAT